MRDPAELISAYFDDSLADGELEELRAWFAADPERMREFARESVIHSRLRDILLQHDMRSLVFGGAFGDAVDPQHIESLLNEEEEAAARREREAAEQLRIEAMASARRDELLDRKLMRIEQPRTPRALIYASVAAAAALLVIVGRLMGPPPNPGVAVVEKAMPRTERPIIASIANTFDATLRWNDRPIAAGDSVQPGRLVLERGVAELRFASGAKIIAEGPAELELMTAERAKLTRGRVVVNVSQPALGFTLHSDAAAFVDLGTEFGVEIDATRRASMHVLDGEVAFVAEKGATPSRTLLRGVATQVSVDGEIRDIPFDESRFVRRVPASAYELAVLKSRPLAYWRLDKAEASSTIASEGRLLIPSFVNSNVTTSDNGRRRGPLSGPPHAAQFKGEHDGIDVPGDAALGVVSNCTYEAWVFPEDAPTGPRRVFSTFDRPRSGMAIGVVDGAWYKLPDDDLKFQLTVYGDYDCLSASPIRLREWVHLAATIDAEGKPRLYVNGDPVAPSFRQIDAVAGVQAGGVEPTDVWTPDAPTPVGRPTGGQGRIGRNPVGSDGQISPERWHGQISNVAVYDRVLGAEEIREHFLATRDTLIDHSGQAVRARTKP